MWSADLFRPALRRRPPPKPQGLSMGEKLDEVGLLEDLDALALSRSCTALPLVKSAGSLPVEPALRRRLAAAGAVETVADRIADVGRPEMKNPRPPREEEAGGQALTRYLASQLALFSSHLADHPEHVRTGEVPELRGG